MNNTKSIYKLFTGTPEVIVHKNKIIKTSLFNRKEISSFKVTFKGVTGNELADANMHGGLDRTIYVYSKEHYNFWKTRRDDLQFEDGIFGENVLLEKSFNETEVFLGDIFKIGSAYFSVSGPRLPCSKLGIRMNDLNFINEFLTEGKTGFYLRLEEEGTIRDGDFMERLSFGSKELSVSDISSLFVQPNEQTLSYVKSSTHLAKDLQTHILKKYTPV